MAHAVLTRDAADLGPYAAALAPLGLDVVAMPVTRTEAPADPDALARALNTGDYAAIVVMSQRAAHELVRAVVSLTSVRATLPDLPDVWVVGAATKRVLDAAKLPAHLPEDVRDGNELVRALAGSLKLRGKLQHAVRASGGSRDLKLMTFERGEEL